MKDLTGKRFGKLVVLFQTENKKHQNRWWKCKCDCGKEVELRTSRLTGKVRPTKSCGCLVVDNHFQLEEGVAALNRLERSYKRGARKRGYTWDLNKDEFRSLVKMPCFYCGGLPIQEITEPSGSFIYNGIDRVDNNSGYTLENVVPCCGTCNKMKNTLTVDEFILHLNKLTAVFLGDKNGI